MVGIKFTFLYNLFIKIYNYFYKQHKHGYFNQKYWLKIFHYIHHMTHTKIKRLPSGDLHCHHATRLWIKTKWFSAHEQYKHYYSYMNLLKRVMLWFVYFCCCSKKCFCISTITEIDREEIHNNFRLVVFSKLLIFFFFLNENSLSLYMDESQTFLKVILTINYKSTIKLLIKDLSNSKCDNDNKKSVISITVSKNCW